MVPNFTAFSGEAHWGEPEILKKSIHVLWQFVENDVNLQDQITDLISQCAKQVPDLDEINAELATWGSDAALAILYSLMCAQEGAIKYAVDAAEAAYNTVDAWIQVHGNLDPGNPNLEKIIAESPIMKREIGFQQKVLMEIERVDRLDRHVVKKLQTLWANDGRSNIDIE